MLNKRTAILLILLVGIIALAGCIDLTSPLVVQRPQIVYVTVPVTPVPTPIPAMHTLQVPATLSTPSKTLTVQQLPAKVPVSPDTIVLQVTTIPTTPVTPAPASVQPACTSDRECSTGNCIDGVCCDTKCEGNCHYCAFPGHVGTCMDVPDTRDPRRACQLAQGGTVSCGGACYSGQCAFPDIGTSCGTCAVCDGAGRCTLTPVDDSWCGVIRCDGLSTAGRTYQDLSSNRCDTLGRCKTADNPDTCSSYTDLQTQTPAPGVHFGFDTAQIIP